jgi:hypothetical protein
MASPRSVQHTNPDGTIPVGPLEIMTPQRRREALAAAPLHDRRSAGAPELALAGHHERFGALTAARGTSTHTAGRSHSDSRSGHAVPSPGLEMRGAFVREYGSAGSSRTWQPTYVAASRGASGVLPSPTTGHRSRITVAQRIESSLAEARRHLSNARLDASLGADSRANAELTAAEREFTHASRLARGARGLGEATRAEIRAVDAEINRTLGAVIAADL